MTNNGNTLTLCYLTPRADWGRAPKRLLEGCVHVEAAVAVGQMLKANTRVIDDFKTMEKLLFTISVLRLVKETNIMALLFY